MNFNIFAEQFQKHVTQNSVFQNKSLADHFLNLCYLNGIASLCMGIPEILA